MFNVNQLELLVLINQSVYCAAYIPSIVKNYRMKTGTGWSWGMLYTFFNGYLASIFYFCCLRLPICWRISVFFQLFCIMILFSQRLYYGVFTYKSVLIILGFSFSIGLALAIIPLALRCSSLVGNAAEWISFGIGLISRLPQIIKIHRERSVYGFSYTTQCIMGIASLMEIGIVLAYKLPLQSLASSVWSLILFVIFTIQFYWFAG
ncbi:PQ-loop repeat-containing protein [Candidatus Dependentiae bacterium]|nr:PQ-loop repeat-containing protein [Candidatus Dependentiae bacterium]